MGPFDAIKTCLAKSLQCKGRTTRSEFWWFTLAISLTHIILATLFQFSIERSFLALIFVVCGVAFAQVSFWSAAIRRFVDAGYLRLFPFVFGIINLIIPAWILIASLDALFARGGSAAEAMMGIGILGFFIWPWVLLVSFLINAPFWLVKSERNSSEVPQ